MTNRDVIIACDFSSAEETFRFLDLFKNEPYLWSWRESNPRPNEEAIRFLHAYLRLNFRV